MDISPMTMFSPEEPLGKFDVLEIQSLKFGEGVVTVTLAVSPASRNVRPFTTKIIEFPKPLEFPEK